MGKLECFAVEGVELWFFSNDHSPPHFHAKRKSKWEVKVHFLESSPSEMFEVVWLKCKAVPRSDTKLLQQMAEEHRAELLKEWETKVQVQ